MIVLEHIIDIIGIILTLLSVLYIHMVVYSVTGFFTTRKFKPAKKQHKYAVLVAARNEETVINNLIESIKRQDYPTELVDIFVVADNCTDNTAQIARDAGAITYERFDNEHRTKGYALQFLVKNIDNDYGVDAYEGYFIFDADNLLKRDFISRMNDAFDSGEKIITSYRNTKNFSDNWISASYGIHWLRTVRTEHRARSKFHLATRIQGTGFLFSWELIKDGWNYTSLTEDRAFSADAVANGYSISYNHEAEFYDEQPTDLKIAMRQRIRWAKGHLQAFVETFGQLFRHIFVLDKQVKEKLDASENKKLDNVRLRYMSYDMMMLVFPRSLTCFLLDIVVFILKFTLIALSTAYFSIDLAPGILKTVFNLFNVTIVPSTTVMALIYFVIFSIVGFFVSYAGNIVMALYVFIIEGKRIPPMPWGKKIWFAIMFPWFDFIGKLSSTIALFTKAEWKPIPHNSTSSISEIEENFTVKK